MKGIDIRDWNILQNLAACSHIDGNIFMNMKGIFISVHVNLNIPRSIKCQNSDFNIGSYNGSTSLKLNAWPLTESLFIYFN